MNDLQPIPEAEPERGWPTGLTAEECPALREGIVAKLTDILGPFPQQCD